MFLEKEVSFVKKHIKFLLIIADVVACIVSFQIAAFLKYDATQYFDKWFIKNGLYIFLAVMLITGIIFIILKISNRMWQ